MENQDKSNRSTKSKMGECEYHLCDKKNVEVFKCPFCGRYFCREHLEPRIPSAAPFRTADRESIIEWHKEGGHPCPDYVETLERKKKEDEEKIEQAFESLSRAPIPVTKEENIESLTTSSKGETSTKENDYKIKVKIKPSRNRIRTIMTILLIFILLSFSIFGCGYYFMNRRQCNLRDEIGGLKSELKERWNLLNVSNNNLDSLKKELENYTISLEENLSELNVLKSGNEYQLHDPLYSEVVNFIKSDDSETIEASIEKAKKQGLRCAYVAVEIVGSPKVVLLGETPTYEYYPLIGFNTIDKGMVYFEPVTDYRVFPEIGKKYVDCVEGKPYLPPILVNDTITDILIIW